MPVTRETFETILHLRDFSGGFSDKKNPTDLAINQTPVVQNVMLTPRGIEKRPGTVEVFSVPGSANRINGLFGKFRRGDDITELFSWHKTAMHRFGGAAWEEITMEDLVVDGDMSSSTNWTEGAGWVIAAGVATATTATSDLEQTITLVEGISYEVVFTLTGFSVGTVTPKIGGTAGTTRSSNATFTETIVAGATQLLELTGAGFTGVIDNVTVTQVTEASFTGADADHFSAMSYGGAAYFSNGVQDIQKHIYGTTARGAVHADAPTAKYLFRYAERVIALYADGFKRRMQWTARGLPNDWAGVGSGLNQVNLIEGEMTGGAVLRDIGLVYQDSGIVAIRETGDVFDPFDFTEFIVGIGLIAPRTLVSFGTSHVFVGEGPRGVNVFQVSLDGIREIGEDIRELLLATIDAANVDNSHAACDPQGQAYVLWLAKTGSPSISALVWQLETETWTKWDRPNTASVPSQSVAALKDASGFARASWLFMGTSIGEVVRYDSSVLRDFGADIIDGKWESKDLRIEDPEFGISGAEVRVGSNGVVVDVSVSFDGGFSWEGDRTFSSLTGTVEIFGSTLVTGVGTAFTTELVVGDVIKVNSENRTIEVITNNTSLTVTVAFDTSAGPGQAITLRSSSVTLTVPTSIGERVQWKSYRFVGYGTSVRVRLQDATIDKGLDINELIVRGQKGYRIADA